MSPEQRASLVDRYLKLSDACAAWHSARASKPAWVHDRCPHCRQAEAAGCVLGVERPARGGA